MQIKNLLNINIKLAWKILKQAWDWAFSIYAISMFPVLVIAILKLFSQSYLLQDLEQSFRLSQIWEHLKKQIDGNDIALTLFVSNLFALVNAARLRKSASNMFLSLIIFNFIVSLALLVGQVVESNNFELSLEKLQSSLLNNETALQILQEFKNSNSLSDAHKNAWRNIGILVTVISFVVAYIAKLSDINVNNNNKPARLIAVLMVSSIFYVPWRYLEAHQGVDYLNIRQSERNEFYATRHFRKDTAFVKSEDLFSNQSLTQNISLNLSTCSLSDVFLLRHCFWLFLDNSYLQNTLQRRVSNFQEDEEIKCFFEPTFGLDYEVGGYKRFIEGKVFENRGDGHLYEIAQYRVFSGFNCSVLSISTLP